MTVLLWSHMRNANRNALIFEAIFFHSPSLRGRVMLLN